MKITINNIKALGVPSGYSDESGKLIDGNLDSSPTPYWGKGDAVYEIDLGNVYMLDLVRVYDFEGQSGVVKISIKENGNFVDVGSLSLENYKYWKELSIDKKSQFIRLVLTENGKISQIELFGKLYGGVIPDPIGNEEIEVINTSKNEATFRAFNLIPETKYTISLNGNPLAEIVTPSDETGNNPPLISNIPNQFNELGDIVNIGISITDSDGDSITVTAKGLPDGLSITNSSIEGKIVGNVNLYNVEIFASDGQDTARQSFKWSISDGEIIPDPAPSDIVAFHEFMGTNVLGDDPKEQIEPVAGNIRVYQWLKWLQEDVSAVDTNAPLSSIKFSFSPSKVGVDLDANYKSFSEIGMTYVTLFESAMWLTGNDKTWLNAVAYKRNEGRNGLDNPSRWAYAGRLYYQFSARYGKTSVDQKYLRVVQGNQPKSGLGYFHYIEGGNEMDRWWIGRDKADLQPEEMAAYMSAIYDGHQGTMREGDELFGARTADPTMKVSLGGLAYVNFDELAQTGKLDWFDRLFTWCEQNRTKPGFETYPFEVINFHDYPNYLRKQRNLSGKGQEPEGYGWREKHEDFVAYLRERVPNKYLELWNTEFGYDVSQSSPQRAEPYAGFNAEEVAGMWTLRCFIEMHAAGINRATHFYLRDDQAGGSGIFSSSGLTIKNGGAYDKRQAWYYFATMKMAVKDLFFTGNIERNSNIHVYGYINKQTNKKAYILWHPTVSGKTSTYQLSVDSSSVNVISLKNNSQVGDTQQLSAQNSKINIQVSEKPVFVHEI